MLKSSTLVGLACSALALVLFPSPAAALDRFEIQVYQADVNQPGQFALELHTNFTITGTETPEYAGQIPPWHVARLTLEPALGITEWFELGGYFQMLAGPVGVRYAGMKLRTKFVLPERFSRPFFFGINAELGRVPSYIEEDLWANEFRPILGVKGNWGLVSFNPIVGYALTGPDKFKPDFEPALKAAANTHLGFLAGLEYYAGFGLLQAPLPLSKQEHLLFAAFDLADELADATGLELNLALGRSLTAAPGPEWIVKSIVGKSF